MRQAQEGHNMARELTGPMKPLTIAEERERMAASGDVEALWQLLLRGRALDFDWEEVFGLLLRAIETRGRRDPVGFAGEMLARALTLTSYLVFRGHHHAIRLLAMHDRSDRGRGSAELPRDLAELFLPRLVELQRHLIEVASAQASVARQWELAKGKQFENQRAGVDSIWPARADTSDDRSPASAPPPGSESAPARSRSRRGSPPDGPGEESRDAV